MSEYLEVGDHSLQENPPFSQESNPWETHEKL